MTPTVPFIRRSIPFDVPPIVRPAYSGDVQWNRPVFKAPPLDVRPPIMDVREFTVDIPAQNRTRS